MTYQYKSASMVFESMGKLPAGRWSCQRCGRVALWAGEGHGMCSISHSICVSPIAALWQWRWTT